LPLVKCDRYHRNEDMAYELPHDFAQQVNDIDIHLNKYEASVVPEEKDELLRYALVVSCNMLSSIDKGGLQETAQDIIEVATRQNQHWHHEIIADRTHYHYFLHTIENRILEAAGVEDHARNRIINNLEKVRRLALTHIERAWQEASVRVEEASHRGLLEEGTARVLRLHLAKELADELTQEAIHAFSNLRSDICGLKEERVRLARQRLKEQERRKRHTRLVKSLSGATMLFNAAAGGLMPNSPPAAIAASIIVGGVAQLI
jgi:hypothetical protein